MITIQQLPRKTEYQPREVAAVNPLRSATGTNLQAIGRKGDHWALDVTIAALDAKACGPELIVDLTRGKTNPVRLSWPDRMGGGPWGAPLVRVAVTGSVLPLKDLPPATEVRKGKFLNVVSAGRKWLYQVADTVVVGGAGNVDVPLTQLLRHPPALNDQILFDVEIEGLISFSSGWSQDAFDALGNIKFTVEERG